MRLAAITDEISQDFEHALDVLLEYNATGAELRGLWNTNIADLSDDQADRAKTALDSRNIRVVCLSTPFFKCDMEDDNPLAPTESGAMHLAKPRGFPEQIDILRRCIHLAHLFGTNYLRIFSFWKKQPLTPEIEDRIIKALAEPLKIAADEGIILLMENEHSCLLGTGEETASLVSKVNSPNLKIVWDPGNAFFAGEAAYPDGYDFVRTWVEHVHIKDGITKNTPEHGAQPQWCVVGKGEIDYKGQFAALNADGYNGYISLETHFRPTTGSGENGEGTPEDGSRLCLAALNKMLQE